MKIHWRIAAWATLSLALPWLAGCCSNLIVRKVPLHQRICGQDKQDGFRYYLSRPYIVIKEPIPLYERKSLVYFPNSEAQQFLDARRSNSRVEFLSPHGQPLIDQDVSQLGDVGAAQLTYRITTGGPKDISNDMQRFHQFASLQKQKSAQPAPVAKSGAGSAVPTNGEPIGIGTFEETAQDATLLSDPEATTDNTLEGKIDVVYLPDFDEQYAIKSKNCMASSKFALSFKNGHELVEVEGDHDSTAVPLAVLSQVQKAIEAGRDIAKQRISSKSSKSTSSVPGEGAGSMLPQAVQEAKDGGYPVYWRHEKASIRPGIYRLNKPWEMEMDDSASTGGLGLLVKLGLPMTAELRFELMGGLNVGK